MDRITAAVNFEGEVYIFTEQGQVFLMYKDQTTRAVLFQLIATLRI